MTNPQKYSVLIGLEKTTFRLLVVMAPLIIEVLPEDWMNITVSGLILLLINYLKNYNRNAEVKVE